MLPCTTADSKLDQSVDVYAFGIVMWEVFTRKPPYAEFAPDFEVRRHEPPAPATRCRSRRR